VGDGQVKVLLADECEDVIDIPSLHVVGCNDPYILGAVALYNMCDPDSAELFDHGKGHTVPRDAKAIKELCDAISRLVVRKETWNNSAMELVNVSINDMTTIPSDREDKKGTVISGVTLPISTF
jgi:hypothetical protein